MEREEERAIDKGITPYVYIATTEEVVKALRSNFRYEEVITKSECGMPLIFFTNKY